METLQILADFRDWFSWFPSEAAGDVVTWTVVIALVVVGFLGTFLPIIPGTTLLWLGVLLHYFLIGMESGSVRWPTLVVITVLYILTLVLDSLSGALGAKWFGSSKWGVIGAITGGLIGLFFGLLGLILGPIIGVFVFELAFAKKKVKEASNSTVGTVVGGIAGIVARVILAFAILIWWTADVFLLK